MTLYLCDALGREVDGRRDAGAVARVDPGGLDVLHDPGHHGVLTVGERVDIDLDGALQVLVDQDARLARQLGVDLGEIGL